MGQIAFVFPGQGAQFPGMGKSLYEGSPAARAVFDQLDAIRPGTSEQCFSASPEELAETRNTQPCLFACELATAYALLDLGITPDMVAGFSLGELAALTVSGAVSLADGFRLVTARGALMQTDAEQVDSAMAAILKLDNDTVEALCRQFPQVYPVNYNCPGQITIACASESLAPFSAAVKEAGGRAMPLKVRGGFHSIFMENASQSFNKELGQYVLTTPRIPLYSNFTSLPYEGDFSALLSQQIRNPVRWEAIIRNMIAAGNDTFIEVGPGNVLTGLIKKIAPEVRTLNVSEHEHLAGIKEAIQSC